MFNEYSYYENIGKENKYFDNIFTKAVMDRFFPFKFEGKLLSNQFKLHEPEKVTLDRNMVEYIKLLRTIEYYRHNWRKEMKPYGWVCPEGKFSPREQATIEKIACFVSLYSRDETEFQAMMKELLKCNNEYVKMITDGHSRNKKKVRLFKPLQVGK